MNLRTWCYTKGESKVNSQHPLDANPKFCSTVVSIHQPHSAPRQSSDSRLWLGRFCLQKQVLPEIRIRRSTRGVRLWIGQLQRSRFPEEHQLCAGIPVSLGHLGCVYQIFLSWLKGQSGGSNLGVGGIRWGGQRCSVTNLSAVYSILRVLIKSQ